MVPNLVQTPASDPEIATGHCDRQRPAVGKGERARALLKRSAGPEDAGGTNEVIAAVLDASHQARGAGSAQAVTGLGSRASEAYRRQRAQSTLPSGHTRETLRLPVRA